MALRLHNTLTGSTDPFRPLEPGRVRLYCCGPTVYGRAHVGNFRSFLFYDLLNRHLRRSGLGVTAVMNVTDIEDKIIAGALEAGLETAAFTAPFEAAFFSDTATLRMRPFDVNPRPTGHIPEMVALIEALLAGGHAYRAEGGVYYRVSSFPGYGALAHLDLRGLKVGARVAQDEYEKESASDFALWKAESPHDAQVGAVWETALGRGRPGWHVECSAMSMRYLGESFDIHCGGVDLLFPHHVNEMAQSEAVTGKPLARFWLHSEHLADLTGEKMSKRWGNVSTVPDLLAAGHDPLAIRFFLIANAHYRTRLRFDVTGLHAAAEQVRRLRDFARRVERLAPEGGGDPAFARRAEQALKRYREALDDDLNLPRGVGHLFDFVREANAALDRGRVGEAGRRAVLALLEEADVHLDVLSGGDLILEEEVERLIAERETARAGREFARADAIRAELKGRGILLEDSREGVRWRRAGPA
ncbi:MAG: cysteine--tRNA ligase [Candidatus Dormibacterales bacterium]